MMLLKVLKVFVVNVFKVRTVQVTKLTFHVRAHFQMNLERLNVIETSVAKFAHRVIKYDLSSLAELTLTLMSQQLMVIEQRLLSYDAFPVVEAYFAK